jgi:4-phospho-D-threonate 3-dehydrogenase / 4-phospho-D-erythronate 3-dehydrogenase
MTQELPLVGLTLGDPSGVGPEIVVRALADPALRSTLRALVVGDAQTVRRAIAGCGLELEVRCVEGPEAVSGASGVVEILDLDNVGDMAFGVVDAACGRAAVESIEATCLLALDGRIDAIVTAPINKEALRASLSRHPGHTEMLADLLGTPAGDVMTMFVLDRLRIFFLTRHLSLADAIGRLDVQTVTAGLHRTDELMRDLGFAAPRIALAALNPHAGEHGLMGLEDDDLLRPAVEALREVGVDVRGPVPADSVFWQCRQGSHDAVLSLYHDQGHIAAKTVSFFGVVSVTLGLPVIRTAAEHGTAFDIAGRWIADAAGQVGAMRTAAELTLSARAR